MPSDGLTREAKALLHDAIEKARGRSYYWDSKGPRCVIGFAGAMVGIQDSVLDAWEGRDVAQLIVSASSFCARRLRYLNVATFAPSYPYRDESMVASRFGLLEHLQYLNDSGIRQRGTDDDRWMRTFMHHVVEMVPTITLYLPAWTPSGAAEEEEKATSTLTPDPVYS